LGEQQNFAKELGGKGQGKCNETGKVLKSVFEMLQQGGTESARKKKG